VEQQATGERAEMASPAPKPRGLGPEYAAQFQDASVVAAYRFRPPHPDETIQFLACLIPTSCRSVLDAGCGTGFIARPLSGFADRVDALDCSQAMIDTAKSLCDPSYGNINWICGKAENAPLTPPYGLITAGDSLHWMEWEIVMPRFAKSLAPAGCLAMVLAQEEPVRWGDELNRLIPRHSTNQDFEPYNLIEELQHRGLFQINGRHRSKSVPFRQPLGDYIESIHARNGFSRERMSTDAANDFDRRVWMLVEKYCDPDRVELLTYSEVIWGKPITR
jgi:SAM-dependent methyltransferase